MQGQRLRRVFERGLRHCALAVTGGHLSPWSRPVLCSVGSAAMAQRGWDHEVRPGWHGDHAARVAARGDHAGVSGQGQPVTRPPAQRAGNGAVGDPARGVDPAEPGGDPAVVGPWITETQARKRDSGQKASQAWPWPVGDEHSRTVTTSGGCRPRTGRTRSPRERGSATRAQCWWPGAERSSRSSSAARRVSTRPRPPVRVAGPVRRSAR